SFSPSGPRGPARSKPELLYPRKRKKAASNRRNPKYRVQLQNLRFGLVWGGGRAMELLRVWVLRGANRWAPVPVLEAETSGGDARRLADLALDFQRRCGCDVHFGLSAPMSGDHQRAIFEFEEEALAQAALQ